MSVLEMPAEAQRLWMRGQSLGSGDTARPMRLTSDRLRGSVAPPLARACPAAALDALSADTFRGASKIPLLFPPPLTSTEPLA